MVVLCRTVNPVPPGKHCWFDSSRSHKIWFPSSKEEQVTVNHQIGYRDSGGPLKNLVYGSALVWMPDCHSGDQMGSIPMYTAKLKSVLELLHN